MNTMNGGGGPTITTSSTTSRGGGGITIDNNNISDDDGIGASGSGNVSVDDAVLAEVNNSIDGMDPLDHYTIVQDHSQKTSSCVWKYFGSLKKNDELIDLKHVYCIKCFDQSKTKKYQKSTSTGNLIKHLKKTHNITDQPSYRIKHQKNRIIVTKEESNFNYPDDGGESDYFLENMPNSGYITLPVNTSGGGGGGGGGNHQNNSNDIDHQIHNHNETNRITAKIEQNDCDHEYLVNDINEVLINEVAKRPAIFDASLCTKNKVQIRRDLWLEIHDSLNHLIPLDKLPKIWKNIRDRYQKIKKDMDKDRRNVKPKYRYFEMLRFLDDVDITAVNIVGNDNNMGGQHHTTSNNCAGAVTVTTIDEKLNVPMENFVSIFLNDHQGHQDEMTHLDPVTMQELVAVKEEIFHHETKRKKIKLDIDENEDHEHDQNQQILQHTQQQQQQQHELDHHHSHEASENHRNQQHQHHHHQHQHDSHEEILMTSNNTKVTIHLMPSDSDDQEHNQENHHHQHQQHNHHHHHHHHQHHQNHTLDQQDEEEEEEQDEDVEHLHRESSTPTPPSPSHQQSSLSSPTTHHHHSQNHLQLHNHNHHHHHHQQQLLQQQQQQQSNGLTLSVGTVHQTYSQSSLNNSTMEISSSPVHNSNLNGDSVVNLPQPQLASSSSSSSSSSQSLSWQSSPMINLSLSTKLPKLTGQPPSTMELVTAQSSSSLSSSSASASLSPMDVTVLQASSNLLVQHTPIKKKSNISNTSETITVATPTTTQKTSEEFTIFCSYVAEVMRNMDKQKARLLQMKVMQLITEYDTN